MSNEKTHYPSSFKAAVALAALRGGESIEEIAKKYAVAVPMVQEWLDTLQQHADAAFAVQESLPSSVPLDSNEVARTIAENSTQGFAMMDSRGYCIFANKAWLDMTGYSAAEIASQPLHYLVHHHHPDGTPYPMEECPIDRALPENFDVRAHEDVFFRKDGSTFDVMCAASPIFRAGQPVATVIEIRDVTEQKKQAAQLIDNEQRALRLASAAQERQNELNAFLDATPVGIGMANASGTVLLVNRANRSLWGENLHLAREVREYREFKGWWADGSARHGRQLRAEEWALARALAGDDIDNDIVEIEPFDQPGVRKTISLSARPIRDELARITGAVVAQVDITLQKQAEDALRQADRNKDEFIAVLAHELRNPLAPIRTAVELFQMLAPDHPVLKRASGAMARQLDHITRLVDDLLDVARISRGKIELQPEQCDLTRIVTQTAEDYRSTLEANQVALHIRIPPQAVWVMGDAARLTQIIGNLLHNASKFTRPGNRIVVSVAHEGSPSQPAAITVADDGAGMEKELVASLFQPFVQATQGLGRSTGGLGLGLALVKGLVELHGGTVDAQSAGPGSGSEFVVRVPVIPSQTVAAANVGEQAQVDRLRIVAIDDNKDVLEMLSLILELHRHEVSLAEDGHRGLDTVRKIRPDVVLCDIGLPGELNGYDVARTIREDKRLAGCLLVAMSGYGQAGDKQKSAAAGFDIHLVKPVDYGTLAAVFEQAANARLG